MLEDLKECKKIEFEEKIIGSTSIGLVFDCTTKVKELNSYITKLNNLFVKDQNNFAELCFYVYKVNELFSNYEPFSLYYGGLLSKNGERYKFLDIMQQFGIDETSASRLISSYEKFCVKVNENEKPHLVEEFKHFGKSKLFELLTVPTDRLIADIASSFLNPDMTVKEIRAYVKNYKASLKQKDKETEAEEEINEKEIPMAYDPTKHYDFDYFENKTKSQLLNIVWELQKEYEKLKEKKIEQKVPKKK